MPLARLHLPKLVPADRQNALLSAVSKAIVAATGKPESYVMVTLEPTAVLMADKPGEGAFVDVRGIGGLTPAVNRRLSRAICDLLKKELQIPSDRVYLNFTDVAAENWGWNGETFG